MTEPAFTACVYEEMVVEGREVVHFPHVDEDLAVALCRCKGDQLQTTQPYGQLRGKRPCKRCAKILMSFSA